MSSESSFEFTKDNIDTYLKAVAKEYRKLVGKNMPAELILIGGASLLVNYGFRSMTTDVDALINAASAMKDAINNVRDKYNLPNGWLNTDFINTASYSDKLYQFSVYYRTYSNIVTVRTIDAEYLIAMKLRAGRQYKRDLSDIIGILTEHKRRGNPITFERIAGAVNDLYGSWGSLPDYSQQFIENVMSAGRYEEMYKQVYEAEIKTKELLISFEQKYPNVANDNNINQITDTLKKNNSESIVNKLKNKQQIPRYNAATEAAIKEANDISFGNKVVKTYSSAEKMFEDLNQ